MDTFRRSREGLYRIAHPGGGESEESLIVRVIVIGDASRLAP